MNRLLCIFATGCLALSLAPAILEGQSRPTPEPQKILLRADLKPGDVLRYELEAAASFLPVADASGAILTPPRGPCDYALAAIVTLHPQAPDKDGNTPVEARYSEMRVTSIRWASSLLPIFRSGWQPASLLRLCSVWGPTAKRS